ncbi:hypothetical protein NLG97_g1692 [Lecanicillium saksenae]|uniref:Uncharacterized protein n=1 Tax=Lecanicillium saksenae TaxID=468837 RepID=A0ACC1R5Q3_9HYPO|nr:hypothetical protein NLG97_g1692 [Lecanicillium saksenae]
MAAAPVQDPVSRQLLKLSELIQVSIARLVEIRESKAERVDVTESGQANDNSAVNGNDHGPKTMDSQASDDSAVNGNAMSPKVIDSQAPSQAPHPLPEKELFDHQRTLLAAAGTLTELVSEPQDRLLEVSSQYFEARALHIAADARISNILAKYGHRGLHIAALAREVGIESRKLSRLLRCLCSIHIFREVDVDVFANNAISASLVDDEHLRAYIMLFGLDLYTSSDHLPHALYDSVKGPSYAVDETAWQDAVGTKKPRWDWLEETTSISKLLDGRNAQGTPKSAYPGIFGRSLRDIVQQAAADGKYSQLRRPEHSTFSLAMVGGGRVFGRAHLHDYPWDSLGEATVVDVGGGVGGFCLQLAQLYPKLKLVLQDREHSVKKAEAEVWPTENPEALTRGRIRFVPHDFFQPNPEHNADVYWLRYILHDWSDDYCVRILNGIKQSMGPRSRILIW